MIALSDPFPKPTASALASCVCAVVEILPGQWQCKEYDSHYIHIASAFDGAVGWLFCLREHGCIVIRRVPLIKPSLARGGGRQYFEFRLETPAATIAEALAQASGP